MLSICIPMRLLTPRVDHDGSTLYLPVGSRKRMDTIGNDNTVPLSQV